MNQFRKAFVVLRSMTTSRNSTYKNILTDKYGGIMTIALNRPEKRNAVDPETARELYQAFTDFEQDSDSLVAVLHGKGGNFCAGYDLSALAMTDSSEAGLQKQFYDSQAPMGPSRMCFSKPVIACIDGYAVAGGLELALLCDLRVVEESAVLGVFCRRCSLVRWGYGETPETDWTVQNHGFNSYRLYNGPYVAFGLNDKLINGRSVTGKEALDIGLANRISATGSVFGKSIGLSTVYSMQ